MNKKIGLGDLAYWAFRPAVYVTDWIWGTDMRHCEVCAARRRRWNELGSFYAWEYIFVLTIGFIIILWGKC